MNIKYGMGGMAPRGRMYQDGGKVAFTMTGQYTSPVMSDDGGEYVIYDSPDGGEVKVYGNWNEYAVSQDDQGNMMIGDEDYPIMQDDKGNFRLDERRFEDTMSAVTEGAGSREMARQSTGGPSASPIEDLLERLGDSPTKFDMGGKMPSELLEYFKNSK